MATLFWKEKTSAVDVLITELLDEIRKAGVNSEQFPTLMTYLERLYDVKAKERRNPVSGDTMALVAGNLMGILLIVAYEQKHVMTSKGISQIIRPR